MQNKAVRYSLFAVFAMIMSIGGVIAAFSADLVQTGPVVLLVALPVALVMLMAAYLNDIMLIPRYFLRQRYVAYVLWAFVLAMLAPLVGIACEAMMRTHMNLPDRIADYLSPWIVIDSLSTASLLMVIMAGMAVARVYGLWKSEVMQLHVAVRDYDSVIEAMERGIGADRVGDALDSIRELVPADPEAANSRLMELSDTLRHGLYDLPKIPVPVSDVARADTSRSLAEFIGGRRYTLLRDLCLKALIVCVCLTAIFEAPDRPDLSLSGLWAFAGMFAVVYVLTYGNKILSKYFLNRGRIRSYAASALAFLVIVTMVMIVIQIASYAHTAHGGALAPAYSAMATVSSFCTIALYFSGITAIIVLHNWLRTVRRTTALRAETRKAELSFLQSQINPHFLFNVLNNAGILIYEDPAMACEMLGRLREMFEYQFRIAHAWRVPLAHEVTFLQNYLLLEQSRKSPFIFDLKVDADMTDAEVPSLLFIPFVENASKHSDGTRDISVRFICNGGRLTFKCRNRCASAPVRSAAGGLGIANTRRRLDLLYGSDYTLASGRNGKYFEITLTIPLK